MSAGPVAGWLASGERTDGNFARSCLRPSMPSWTRSRLRPPKRLRSLQRKAWISAESCNLNAPMTARGESAGNPCQHVALQTISVSFPRADPKLARSAGGRCGGGGYSFLWRLLSSPCCHPHRADHPRAGRTLPEVWSKWAPASVGASRPRQPFVLSAAVG